MRWKKPYSKRWSLRNRLSLNAKSGVEITSRMVVLAPTCIPHFAALVSPEFICPITYYAMKVPYYAMKVP